ncbi:hypothetical protein L4D77_20335 [Photobacterium frigidiphilum]|uniref:hypothetical protein n=1 Tax=Photobacterium frigidiphilum TaxID=264736 RepID=UPI003D146ED7
MLKVTNWKDLKTLPITPTLLEQIKLPLLYPFHDETEAQEAWEELQCELWMVTSLPDIPADGDDRNMLTFALEYIEFEETLDYGAILSLSILNDSGQGLYLLMTKQLQADVMQILGVNDE